MYEEYAAAAEQVRPFVTDTGRLLNKILAEGGSVMFEGAQGTMLDIDHGTYPFVTSSSATAGGAATGTGVGPTAIGTVISVTKAYVTRVGEGPFPTEIHDAAGDHLRARGNEYGAVTGRPRRCGWLDIPLLRYSNQVNGAEWLVVTKLDVLDELEEIPDLRGLRDRRQGDGRDSRRRAGPGADQAAVYDAEGLAGVRPRGSRSSTSCPRRRRSICAFRSARAGRESAWSPPGRTGTRPSLLPEFAAALDEIHAVNWRNGLRAFTLTGQEGNRHLMVSFIVRLKFAPEDRAEVAETLRLLAAASRREPGCVSYIPHHLEDDPDTVLIYEQYRDAQALEAHRESEHFKNYAVGGLLQKMRERSVENLVALV